MLTFKCFFVVKTCEMKLYFGSSCQHLKPYFDQKFQILSAECETFSDGEQVFTFQESVKSEHITYIHSTCRPTHQNFMELFITISTLQQQGAIVDLVMPYTAYTRSVNAPYFARFINALQVNKFVVLDIHIPNILDWIQCQKQHLTALPLFQKHILENFSNQIVLVSPDFGARAKVDSLSKETGFMKAHLKKERHAGRLQSCLIDGDVRNKTCILVDDVIDSGATILEAGRVLKENGANDIHVYATHGIFSVPPFTETGWGNIKSVTVTTSCPPIHGVSYLPIEGVIEKILI